MIELTQLFLEGTFEYRKVSDGFELRGQIPARYIKPLHLYFHHRRKVELTAHPGYLMKFQVESQDQIPESVVTIELIWRPDRTSMRGHVHPLDAISSFTDTLREGLFGPGDTPMYFDLNPENVTAAEPEPGPDPDVDPIAYLEEKMRRAVEREDYEEAAEVRDQLQLARDTERLEKVRSILGGDDA